MIDPSIYDAPVMPDAIKAPEKTAGVVANYVPPEQSVPQEKALGGSAVEQQGKALLEQNNREHASFMASSGAAFSEWSTAKLYKGFTGPTFPAAPNYNSGEQIQKVDISLAGYEEADLLKSRSPEEFQYKLDNIKESRIAQQAIGDHPVAGLVVGSLDPVYLGIDIASAGVGRFSRSLGASRLVERGIAGASAAGGAYGVGKLEQQFGAVDDKSIIANALLNGLGTAMMYRGGKLEPADRELEKVQEPFNNLPQEIEGKGMPTNPDAPIGPRVGEEPVYRPNEQQLGTHDFSSDAPVSGRTLAESLIDKVKGTEYEGLLNHILGTKEIDHIEATSSDVLAKKYPNMNGFWQTSFSPSTGATKNTLFLKKGGNVSTALHELVHATLETRIRENPKLLAELRSIRETVFSSVNKGLASDTSHGANWFRKLTKASDAEFIAYAYTSPEFREILRKHDITATGLERATQKFDVAKPTKLTALDKVMDFFKKVLGMEPTAQKAFDTMMAKYDEVQARMAPLDVRLNKMASEAFQAESSDLYHKTKLKAGRGTVAELSADLAKDFDANGRALGEKLSWSLHKTLSKYSKAVADLLVDNPIDMRGDSVTSQKEAIRRGFSQTQAVLHDMMVQKMAANGYGVLQRIFKAGEALRVQQSIEKELQKEMLLRDSNYRKGLSHPRNPDEDIAKMADHLDKLSHDAVQEMKNSGVFGAEDLEPRTGYFQRRWDITKIERVQQGLMDAGLTEEQAVQHIKSSLTQNLISTNGWDAQLAKDVAGALLDRAKRKGYFEDSAFRSHAGNDAAREVRDVLTSAGLPNDRLQRAMDVITGVVDEAGKAPMLKHRVDIDMTTGHGFGGFDFTMGDLIDNDMLKLTDSYLDNVAANSALARKGLGTVSSIDKIRNEMLHGITREADRAEAVKLFDNTIAQIKGHPAGEDIPQAMRNVQAFTQMVGLSSSGLWQLTEYATAMHRYGLIRTLRYFMAEMPLFKQIMGSVAVDKGAARDLRNILADQANADLRMKPFMQRMEDNFEIPKSDVLTLSLHQAKQLVPYINMMKYVHGHQARMVSNLIADTLHRAAKGDSKAIQIMERYGLDSQVLDKIKADITQHGMDTAKWSDKTFESIRGPLTKMVDESVLKNRLGEIPAFAQFTSTGKFIFTFRSFVLASHNKVLAHTLNQDGLAGLSGLMLYQFPLALMASHANATLKNKKAESEGQMAMQAIGQMGSTGLFSELFGIVSGQKQQFGAPGLLAVDRVAQLVGATAQGNWSQAGSQVAQTIPLLSVIPGIKAMGALALQK